MVGTHDQPLFYALPPSAVVEINTKCPSLQPNSHKVFIIYHVPEWVPSAIISSIM